MPSSAHPLDHVAAAQVDDVQAAPRRDALRRQLLVQRQPAEGLLVARLRQADDRVVAHEGQAAQVAGAERQRLERAAAGATLPSRPVPELSSHNRPRCKRGECGIDRPEAIDLVAPHVDDAAAVAPPVAPAVDHVASCRPR